MKRTEATDLNSPNSRFKKPRKASDHRIQEHYFDNPFATNIIPKQNHSQQINYSMLSNNELIDQINKLKDKISMQYDQIRKLNKLKFENLEQIVKLKQQIAALKCKIQILQEQIKVQPQIQDNHLNNNRHSLAKSENNLEKTYQTKIIANKSSINQEENFKLDLKKLQERINNLQNQKNCSNDKIIVDKLIIYNMMKMIKDLNKKINLDEGKRTPSRAHSNILEKFQRSSNHILEDKKTIKKTSRGEILNSYYAS